MTTAEALAFAEEVRSRRHKPAARTAFNKLHDGDALAKHAAGVTALSKRFGELGAEISGMTKQLDQVRADLDHLENNPGAKRRIIH